MRKKYFLASCVLALAGCSETATKTETHPQQSDVPSHMAQSTAQNGPHNTAPQNIAQPPNGPGGMPPKGPPPEGAPPGGFPPPGFPGGRPGQVITGSSAFVVENGQYLEGQLFTSLKSDENAIRSEGETSATLNDVTIRKVGGDTSNNDGSSFYGLNAALLATDKSDLTINGGSINTSVEGANGVFAYGDATIRIKDTFIKVTGGNAGGIEVAGGGAIYANNLTVNSTVKAAIRSDRGGGLIEVDGGTYTTQGSMGAPAIYSTADIRVKNATLKSNNSEAVVVEGLNSVSLTNVNLSGRMDGHYNRQSDKVVRNVMLYQSMSGDAQEGTSSFTMNGGTLTSENGDMFYVTNTDSVINLNNVTLNLAKDTRFLLVAGNNEQRGWGRVGQNGGICVLNLNRQTVKGDTEVDSISRLEMNISNESNYTGAINSELKQSNVTNVTIDASSSWTLTDDSYVLSLNGATDNVHLNGHNLYVNGQKFVR